MEKTCAYCRRSFSLTSWELDFLRRASPTIGGKTFGILPPSHCPDCRQLRRLSFRNERTYYRRKCDLSGEQILSVYPEDAPFPVYSTKSFWSDGWDPLSYGMDVQVGASFFEQFAELQKRVPRLHFSNTDSENSEYCNHVGFMRNCYLVVGSMYSEDCYYGTRVFHSRNCIDCLFIDHCELCYECVNCENCYGVCYAFNCRDVHDSRWIMNCSGSSNLLFCVNIRQGEYRILNKQYSKEEFEKVKAAVMQDAAVRKEYESAYEKMLHTVPMPATISHLAEECSGNFITQSKNAQHAFDVSKVQDVMYAYDAGDIQDCMDVFSFYGPGELCYDSYSGAIAMHHCLFIRDCWPGDSLLYCDHCFGCKDCFGCIGLQKKQYCILNRQYTREEYERIVPQIIEGMMKHGEWSEFFPIKDSPFPYNDSMAQEARPLTEKEAAALGYRWKEKHDGEIALPRVITASELPDDIRTISDDVLNWAIRCSVTGKVFRLIPQELAFYRQMQLPLPQVHASERHRRRKLLKNPRTLWERSCAKCTKQILSTYEYNRPEIVYCDDCYSKEVY